ncbi:ABC transporter permease [Antarcticimicrobium luteum]|uniref:ABC transporter permease n=1 Tax=Antarcticimicrobium luteum TaxID=2547397 RepID=A0A4R5V9Y0_9RHOB|nr:ABC transporter permease [Antarcticimicrobium luteum]TDK48973.1 ABC transporter permease [Antarcticimicrobium luteum]
MRRSMLNTLRLIVKELRALRGDKVMIVLILYVFTLAVWLVSMAASTEVHDLSVAVVNEDHSPLSERLIDSIQERLFAPPDLLSPDAAARAQLGGAYVIVLTIPPRFEQDLRTGREATLLLSVDATAVAFAGNGTTYLTMALSQALDDYLKPGMADSALVDVVFRNRYNPNLRAAWFTSVMQLMSNVTILMLILSGSSMIREREHGTIEHVLVMPVRPHEIVLSKIAAMGLVILIASVASLLIVVQGAMGVPVAGSLWLYILGAAVYVVAIGSLGLMLASFTRNMGQFGLLVIPIIVILYLLSGGVTPLESMPDWLRIVMLWVNPSAHFVTFAQSVLYRGSGLSLVYPELLAIGAMAAVALTLVLSRFRKILS